jgi:chemotaxis protein CheD
MHIENTRDVILASTSLGSGVGLAAYDPDANIGGILHFLLPSSANNKYRAKKNPFLFADTGISAFLEQMYQHGVRSHGLKLVAAGASHNLNQGTPYDMAQRNCLAVKSILAGLKLTTAYEDFGGSFYRILRIQNGYIYVEVPGHGEKKV